MNLRAVCGPGKTWVPLAKKTAHATDVRLVSIPRSPLGSEKWPMEPSTGKRGLAATQQQDQGSSRTFWNGDGLHLCCATKWSLTNVSTRTVAHGMERQKFYLILSN